MRLGIFLCTCNSTININFKSLKKAYSKDAEVIEINDQLCHSGLDYIIGDIKRKKLENVIICCTEKNEIFEAEVKNCNITFLNLREQCGWVHEEKEATKKAKGLIRSTIFGIGKGIRAEEFEVDVGYDVLVVGSFGPSVANYLSNIANVHFLADNIDFDLNTFEYLKDLKIHIGNIKNVSGNIGNFRVEISSKIDLDRCISCGICAEICPKDSIKYDIFYMIDHSCDGCEKCIEKCPVDAIDLQKTRIINVGQILAIDQTWDWYDKNIFGIYTSDEKDAFSNALLLASNLGVIRKKRFLDLDLKQCAAERSGLEGCDLCFSCPHDSVVRSGDRVVFNEISCQGCGFCSSVCPISLPRLKEYKRDFIYSKMKGLLSADLEKNILLFTCDKTGLSLLDYIGKRKQRYPAVLPLSVPCINSVSEADILTAFNLGADGVILLTGCKDCDLKKKTKDHVGNVVEFSNSFLSAFNLGERTLHCDAGSPWDFLEDVSSFSERLTRLPMNRGIIQEGNKREILLSLARDFSDKTCIIPEIVDEKTTHPFSDIEIGSGCTICNACSGACPVNALSISSGKINFVYGYCIACGLCEKVCPENVLKLKRSLDFSKLISLEEVNLSRSEPIGCAGCGKEYISKSALDKMTAIIKESSQKPEFGVDTHLELLTYCEDCRALLAIEKISVSKNKKGG